MIERDGYPHGVPCWIDIETADPAVAKAFYGAVFGWEFEERDGGDAPYHVAQLHGRDVAAIGSPRPGAVGPPVWNTYVAVDDVDAVAARAAEAGGAVLAPGTALGDLARTAVLADPSGAQFRLWQARAHGGAVLVNVSETWNMSDLVTPDTGSATRFYGHVFGWAADAVDLGGWTTTMLCAPGYGDVLAALDPDLRARHAEPGVPPGFSDAIGWLEPLDAEDVDRDGEGARWRVTFAVDDPDEIVRRTEMAGGEVVVAPYDITPVRTAVLADPVGATFTVSSYRP